MRLKRLDDLSKGTKLLNSGGRILPHLSDVKAVHLTCVLPLNTAQKGSWPPVWGLEVTAVLQDLAKFQHLKRPLTT